MPMQFENDKVKVNFTKDFKTNESINNIINS